MIETPNKPLNVQVSREQLHVYPESYTLSVRWDPPDNSDKLDLEHFKVLALSEHNNRYIANGTTTELGYRFNSDIIPLIGNVHISVSVVSKCSQQGLRSSAVEWREDTNRDMFTSGPNTVKTDMDLTALKEYDVINCGNVTVIIL